MEKHHSSEVPDCELVAEIVTTEFASACIVTGDPVY